MKTLKKPKDDQVGLKKLPEDVRNKMGFMKDGGTIEYKKGGKVKKKKKGKGKGYASLTAAQKQVYKRPRRIHVVWQQTESIPTCLGYGPCEVGIW